MATSADTDPTVPVFLRVRKRRRELADTWTLELAPDKPFGFLPGQFNMLYVFAVGEAPISISGDPGKPDVLVHTVRAVGKATAAMCALRPGERIGVRGPYGVPWPLEAAEGGDVVVVAGGIGLAPLRPALYHLMANRDRYRRVCLLYGGRSPELLLYPGEFRRWRSRFDIEAEVTVDAAGPQWRGNVGVVTKLIDRAAFDPETASAFVCGPEVMMRFATAQLMAKAVPTRRIYVSMERNMKCAVGLCGHCQYGPQFICRDGPVFPLSGIERIFRIRQI